jgi:hypothetical protein
METLLSGGSLAEALEAVDEATPALVKTATARIDDPKIAARAASKAKARMRMPDDEKLDYVRRACANSPTPSVVGRPRKPARIKGTRIYLPAFTPATGESS